VLQTAYRRLAADLADVVCREPVWSAPPLSPAPAAFLAWGLHLALDRPVLLVVSGPHRRDTLFRDARTLAPDNAAPPAVFPAREERAGRGTEADPDLEGQRLHVLLRLRDRPPPLLCAGPDALAEPLPAPETLHAAATPLRVGATQDPEALAARLDAQGYAFVPRVDAKGQAAARGGVLDVWPLTEAQPLRIEFFGSTIESMRRFAPADQKSVAPLDAAVLTPVGGPGAPSARLADYLPADTLTVWCDPDAFDDHSRGAARPQHVLLGAAPPGAAPLDLALHDLDGAAGSLPAALEPDRMETARRLLLDSLRGRAGAVLVLLDTEGAREHFREQEPAFGAVRVGMLSRGFHDPVRSLTVVAQSDLYGPRHAADRLFAPDVRAAARPPSVGERLADLGALEPGDLVVHVEHGIGRALGLNTITVNGRPQDVLTVEYAEGARLHVPVADAHLLSRYVGASKRAVTLHKLGGRRWTREKEAADRGVQDLAAGLLRTQAERRLLKGFAFPPDTPWQHEFEAAFPYRETPDQHAAAAAIKQDLESERPMDRLVCGDAGFGKTEVAMRAVFKTVTAARQAAVLVPTTVLAQQHLETFRERMAAYPVRIEMLSRFRSEAQRRAVLAALADGTVDVVIGTHALLQPRIRFKNLGLVVIDEEQRFGVRHKERLKDLRRLVDVLTLTATPIPRTLYMSLTGARDMSLMQTPPSERMAIETIVTRNTDAIVTGAVCRELARGGQVFFLHNRVMTIGRVAARLRRLVPDARVGTAHGQMPARELAAVMHAFVAGELDVLLCTTIIESGVDIPRANTILIDRADRFGIADLYQLRGRVGRSSHKAYAYLLLPEAGWVDSDARRRIHAVQRHSGLSAGFQLALRDLEIRGAGNLLGPEQSGHIAAVGYTLYCQLLRRTIDRMEGRAPALVVDVEVRLDFLTLAADLEAPEREAVVPHAYVEDEGARLDLYRRLAEAATPDDLDLLRGEMRDRFGPLPPPVERLLRVGALRIACAARGIQRVESRAGKILFTHNGEFIKDGPRFPRHAGRTPDAKLDELLRLAAAL
jgi:transcription-repair coupling factor (superfamily II helicase)